MNVFRKLLFCSKPISNGRGGEDECAVCQDTPTEPCTVPCGNQHTFCRACLQGVIDHNHHRRHFPCPLCRNQVEIPLGGVGLYKNDGNRVAKLLARIPALRPGRCRRRHSSSISDISWDADVWNTSLPHEIFLASLDSDIYSSLRSEGISIPSVSNSIRRGPNLDEFLSMNPADLQVQIEMLEQIRRERVRIDESVSSRGSDLNGGTGNEQDPYQYPSWRRQADQLRRILGHSRATSVSSLHDTTDQMSTAVDPRVTADPRVSDDLDMAEVMKLIAEMEENDRREADIQDQSSTEHGASVIQASRISDEQTRDTLSGSVLLRSSGSLGRPPFHGEDTRRSLGRQPLHGEDTRRSLGRQPLRGEDTRRSLGRQSLHEEDTRRSLGRPPLRGEDTRRSLQHDKATWKNRPFTGAVIPRPKLVPAEDVLRAEASAGPLEVGLDNDLPETERWRIQELVKLEMAKQRAREESMLPTHSLGETFTSIASKESGKPSFDRTEDQGSSSGKLTRLSVKPSHSSKRDPETESGQSSSAEKSDEMGDSVEKAKSGTGRRVSKCTSSEVATTDSEESPKSPDGNWNFLEASRHKHESTSKQNCPEEVKQLAEEDMILSEGPTDWTRRILDLSRRRERERKNAPVERLVKREDEGGNA